jgi:hypothetical protein
LLRSRPSGGSRTRRASESVAIPGDPWIILRRYPRFRGRAVRSACACREAYGGAGRRLFRQNQTLLLRNWAQLRLMKGDWGFSVDRPHGGCHTPS